MTNVVANIWKHAKSTPDRVAYRFLKNNGQSDTLTYGQLDLRVRTLAAHFREWAAPGDRAREPWIEEAAAGRPEHAVAHGCGRLDLVVLGLHLLVGELDRIDLGIAAARRACVDHARQQREAQKPEPQHPATPGASRRPTGGVRGVGCGGAVSSVPPVVKEPKPEAAEFRFNWLSATGTALPEGAVAPEWGSIAGDERRRSRS